ncbi:MAG: dicarboxylate/amino acid:cation symporter [Bacteroidetes bacterium]|nr:dicarboxylate/amino acid:cation symporter [Bacteroidota bacterium]
MKKKLALHWKILIGMVLGVIWGFIAIEAGLIQFTTDWIKPFGTIFINLLKLIAVPLIIVSIINGVSNLTDITKLSRIGLKTISLYMASTVIAIIVGLLLVNMTNPGNLFPSDKREAFQAKYEHNIESKQSAAAEIKQDGPLQTLVDIVPNNIFRAMTDNSKMLQVIFFVIMFGIAMVMLPTEKTKPVKSLISSLNEIILKLIDIIMRGAPYGVFALLAALIVDVSGDMNLFAALGLYALTVITGLLLMIFIIYPGFLSLLTKTRFFDFLKGIVPAQLLAFSTSSSAATLPLTIDCCEKNLGVSKEVSSFVLPLGATINMDGTSLYQAVAAIFITQAFGYDLTLSMQLTIVLTATLASIGAAAVPGAGMVMLVIVLEAIGVPSAGIALIFAVDRPLDMLRTVVNITGDSTITTIVSGSEKRRMQKAAYLNQDL